MRKIWKNIINIYTVLGFIFITGAVVIVAVPLTPFIVYRLSPQQSQKDAEIISEDLVEEKNTSITVAVDNSNLPPFDESLPKDNYVSIPEIGVYSPIESGNDYEKVLESGTWLVPDYGTPSNGLKPIILAAHRFGYVYWDRETRNTVSYYNLPKTHVGDTIYIIWDQRAYEYEITAESESTYIEDYSSDLILYTCKYFNSPIRIFRYATRVN